MSVRITLRSPDGQTVVRDVGAGRWVEPGDDIPAETFGAEMWALPGLADAHAHLATAELDYQPGVYEEAVVRARQAVDAGVNLVLDKGWRDATAVRIIDQVDRADRPEMEAAARLIAAPGGYYPEFAHEVHGTELERAVVEEAAAGRGWVKIVGDWPRKGVGPVPNFSLENLTAAVDTAHGLGARVAIHTMAREVPSIAVEAGVDSIEHGLFLRQEDIETLAARRGMWVPTVLRDEAILEQLGAESSGGKLFRVGLDNLRRLLPIAAEAGVRVLAGTDLIGSAKDVAQEALALRRYGLSDAQVMRSVSTDVYEATGRTTDFSPGSDADAVFFPANPLEDIEVLAHPAAKMRLGRLR